VLMSIRPFSCEILRTASATDEVPSPVIILTFSCRTSGARSRRRHRLGLVIGRQHLDRPAQHLAAGILDRHLHRFDLAEIEVGIDAREAFHDADLERLWRLRLSDGDGPRGCQAGRGRHQGGKADGVCDFSYSILPHADSDLRTGPQSRRT